MVRVRTGTDTVLTQAAARMNELIERQRDKSVRKLAHM